MKNSKFSYKDILYKSKRLKAVALTLILCGGLAVTSNVDTESDIPIHDGEILVDSLSISENEPESLKADFETMRAKFELERNNLISTYDETINNSKNDNEIKNASDSKSRIMDYMETELTIESIIESKNLPDSFVLITENCISVTVDEENLDTNTVAKICDIVMRETGQSADKIIIQSKY